MSSLLAALAIIFIAELGDKTQLVALGLGARHSLRPVLTGVALAYLATNTLSVAVGGLLGAALPTDAIGLVGGILFLGFALWTLRGDREQTEHPPADDVDLAPGASTGRTVLTVAGAMFVAELGDKTMLATATLAAKDNPLLVWIGAMVGIFAAGALGVVVGRAVGAKLPARAIRLASAALFAVFGVVLIVTSLT